MTTRFLVKAAILAVLASFAAAAPAAAAPVKKVATMCPNIKTQAGFAMRECRLVRPDTLSILLAYAPAPVYGIVWDVKCGKKPAISKQFLPPASRKPLAHKQILVDARHNRNVYRLVSRSATCQIFFTALAVQHIKPTFAAGIIYTQRPVAR